MIYVRDDNCIVEGINIYGLLTEVYTATKATLQQIEQRLDAEAAQLLKKDLIECIEKIGTDASEESDDERDERNRPVFIDEYSGKTISEIVSLDIALKDSEVTKK